MIDIQLLRKDSAAVAKGLAARGYDLDTQAFDALEAHRKGVQLQTEALQASRNALSKQIGQAKAKGEDASALMAQVAALPEQLSAAEAELAAIQADLDAWLVHYNTERPHLGYRNMGRRPLNPSWHSLVKN